ncbi:MAG: M23 family metallopeptidase [Defluviitaleaceae bacterium]|nr:M23 family metallopeptidase [Defluviitaleaceae bacterium]
MPEFHTGIDISADVGTRVLAVKSGVITVIRYSQTFGHVLEFETNDGYEIMFAHLDSIIVEVGQTVEQGQILAFSGNSGMTTGPHLHYEIRRDGEPIDPTKHFQPNQ